MTFPSVLLIATAGEQLSAGRCGGESPRLRLGLSLEESQEEVESHSEQLPRKLLVVFVAMVTPGAKGRAVYAN